MQGTDTGILSVNLETFAAANRELDFVAWLACRHHKTHKNEYLNFAIHPYQKKIYHDKSKYLVIIKSTQNGISEYLLVRALAHAIDGLRVFYVLPTFELVKRFVDERYTKTVQNTPYYRMLVRAVREEMDIRQTESVKAKDIGEGNIAFVNSYSSVGFTEYPADEVIIDELDKCDPKNVEMAWERLSHSDFRWQVKISNPTFKGFGIDAEYETTDKNEWFVECQAGHRIRLNWFKHIVEKMKEGEYVIRDREWNWNSSRDIMPICECGKPVNRNGAGLWVPEKQSRKRGYRLTKLFTGTVTVAELMDRFQKGLVNNDIMQRFYNADLGEAYTAEGAKISDIMLDGCVADYTMPEALTEGACVAGIDVGAVFHVVIVQLRDKIPSRAVYIGTIRDPEEVVRICMQYRVRAGVIDALPEKRIASAICNALPGMFMCFYGANKRDVIHGPSKTITVDRTAALDNVKETLLLKNLELPKNARSISDFYPQMCSSTRLFDKDANRGEGAYVWNEWGQPDHFFHATGYCLIARRLFTMLSR
jgi:hypothetical protein